MFSPLFLYGVARDQVDRDAGRSIAESAQRKAYDLETTVEILKCDIERLLMISEALWTILKQKNGLQDEDLTKVISEIDLRDGKLDGKVAPDTARKCPNCGQILGKRRPFCYYCGKPIELQPFDR